MGLKQEKKV